MPGTDIKSNQAWKRKLRELAQAMGTTPPEAVRQLVEEAHARLRQEKRRQSTGRVATASRATPGEPRELRREARCTSDGPSAGPHRLGDRIREARLRAGVGLRAMAAELGVSPSYLSDIENGWRVPTHRVLERLAHRLGLDPDALLAAAGRLDPETARYLRWSPAAVRLLHRISRLRLGEADLRTLEQQVGCLAERRVPNVKPLERVEDLEAPVWQSDEELEQFLADVYAARRPPEKT